MDSLKICYHNQVCTIKCLDNDFSLFIKQLQEKLQNRFFQTKDHFQAFFSFPFVLDEANMIALSEVCDRCSTLIMGIDMPTHVDDEIKIKQHSFYNGNHYCLHGSHVYIGSIDEDVSVVCDGDLYVIGEIRGQVDLLYSHSRLSASSLSSARIRIFDSSFQNLTNIAPCSVYYDDKEGVRVR